MTRAFINEIALVADERHPVSLTPVLRTPPLSRKEKLFPLLLDRIYNACLLISEITLVVNDRHRLLANLIVQHSVKSNADHSFQKSVSLIKAEKNRKLANEIF